MLNVRVSLLIINTVPYFGSPSPFARQTVFQLRSRDSTVDSVYFLIFFCFGNKYLLLALTEKKIERILKIFCMLLACLKSFIFFVNKLSISDSNLYRPSFLM